MAENKTMGTKASVTAFLKRVTPETRRREDCRAGLETMKQATRSAPKMWGPLKKSISRSVKSMKQAHA